LARVVVQIDLFAARGACAGAVGRIKTDWDQDRGPAPALADIAWRRDGAEKTAFAAPFRDRI